MKLMKEAREATVKKAQRLEEILGRSIHIPKGGNKKKRPNKVSQRMNLSGSRAMRQESQDLYGRNAIDFY